jgi:transposase
MRRRFTCRDTGVHNLSRTSGAMGEDVSDLLDMIAAQMKVLQIARIKKSCRRCEKMVQEPAPSRPIPGSMAGPSLLAHVLVSKFDPSRAATRQACTAGQWITFLYTASMRSSPAWGQIFLKQHWSAG